MFLKNGALPELHRLDSYAHDGGEPPIWRKVGVYEKDNHMSFTVIMIAYRPGVVNYF